MRRILYCLVFAAGLSLLVAGGALGATQMGVYGATDLMWTPTPHTLNPGTVSLAADFLQGGDNYFNADLGLAENLEVGLTVEAFQGETTLSGRGKYQILKENGNNPSLAIGVEDISSGAISPYLVVGKTFPAAGVQGYLGFGGNDFNGLFGGLSKNFTFSKGSGIRRMQLFVEADSWEVNVGTRFDLSSQVQLNFGLVNMKDWILGARFTIK